MRGLTLFNILSLTHKGYDYARREKYLEKILHTLSKWLLRIITTIMILIVAAILFIRIIYLYEENKFINNCVEEGNSQEKARVFGLR